MNSYVVCPGYVRSRTDGDVHYVGVAALVRLYQLRPGEWRAHGRRDYLYADNPHERYLHPREDGCYGRPDTPKPPSSTGAR